MLICRRVSYYLYEDEFGKRMEVFSVKTFNSSVHGSTTEFTQILSTEICLEKVERLVKTDHKIRAEIEPTFSNNRLEMFRLDYHVLSH